MASRRPVFLSSCAALASMGCFASSDSAACHDELPELRLEDATPSISEEVHAAPGEQVEFNVEFTTGECEMALAYLWLDFGTAEQRGIGYSDLILASMDSRKARPLRFDWVPDAEDVGCHTVTLVIGEEANFARTSQKPTNAAEIDTAVWQVQVGDTPCGDAGAD